MVKNSIGTEPFFFDQRITVKPAGKNLAGVTAHGIVGLGASQGKVKTLWARGCLAGCWKLDDVAEGASVTVC